MKTTNVTKRRALVVAGLGAMMALAGCELLVDFDRTKIDAGATADGGDDGPATDGTGGDVMPMPDSAADTSTNDAPTESGGNDGGHDAADAADAGHDATPESGTEAGTDAEAGVAMLVMSPSMHTFPAQANQTSSAAFQFTVTNMGTATSSMPMSPTITGTNMNDFSIMSTDCNAALAPNATCHVNVQFTPLTTGMGKTATVNLPATMGGPATATVTGDSVTQATLVMTPTTEDYGTTAVGTQTSDLTFTVQNTGGVTSGTLGDPTPALDGGAGDYTVTNNTCHAVTLAPNATCTFQVHFTPSAAGVRAGSFSVTATPGGTVTNVLTGLGALSMGTFTIAPTTHPYGTDDAGAMTSSFSFTVTNNTAGSVTPTAIAIDGNDATQFVNDGTGTCMIGNAIAMGATCTVNVKFAPTTPGNKAASLSVTVAGATASASLTGTGN